MAIQQMDTHKTPSGFRTLRNVRKDYGVYTPIPQYYTEDATQSDYYIGEVDVPVPYSGPSDDLRTGYVMVPVYGPSVMRRTDNHPDGEIVYPVLRTEKVAVAHTHMPALSQQWSVEWARRCNRARRKGVDLCTFLRAPEQFIRTGRWPDDVIRPTYQYRGNAFGERVRDLESEALTRKGQRVVMESLALERELNAKVPDSIASAITARQQREADRQIPPGQREHPDFME